MKKKKNKVKDFSNDNRILGEFIMQDFVNDLESEDSPNVSKHLDTLIENNRACKIEGTCDTYYGSPSMYRIGCKFMYKHNHNLKNYRRILQPYEFGGEENKFSSVDPEFIEITKYTLENGTYYCQMDKNNYAMMVIKKSDSEDSYLYDYEISFIGKNWMKWKEKMYKEYDRMMKLWKLKKNECIVSSSDNSRVETVFKPFDQIIFKEKESLIKYIDNWKKNIPTYYNDYKIISKLCILFYGKPGTGKSTTAKAIAKYLGIERVTSIGSDYFNDNDNSSNYGNKRRLSNYAVETVYAIDDIDCICKSREEDHTNENAAILSNLLSFLDNPPTFYFKADDGIRYPVSIVIATTNYIDKLDDAVKRHGRFDLKIEMKDFDKDDAEAMCKIYHLNVNDICPDCNKKGFTVSPSYLQAKCLENLDKSMKEI